MPKLKSHRGAAKRFKPTAKGYKCAQSHHNHILTKKAFIRTKLAKRKKSHSRETAHAFQSVLLVLRRLIERTFFQIVRRLFHRLGGAAQAARRGGLGRGAGMVLQQIGQQRGDQGVAQHGGQHRHEAADRVGVQAG